MRIPIPDIDHIYVGGKSVVIAKGEWNQPMVIVEKIHPRRIVLEETDKISDPDKAQLIGHLTIYHHKIWREVKE